MAASTGRPSAHEFLTGLGAGTIVDRNKLLEPGRPLQKECWSGVVDTVGGVTLVNALSQTVYGGAAAACGLAGGSDLVGATVLPHILRGVALLGVDSVMAPQAKRKAAWSRLARDLKPDVLASLSRVEPMSALPSLAPQILQGQVQGRVVIDVTA